MLSSFIKKNMPGLYDDLQHFKRIQTIHRIDKEKSSPAELWPQKCAEIYETKIGHKLDWEHLESYTEKMQWEKLFDCNPKKVELADKFVVREWVSKKIGDDYLIPLIGVWDSVKEIDYSLLPNQFVLKTNHGSGTNIIVRDKSTINISRINRQLNDWMHIDYAFYTGYEMHYSLIKRKILAEKYIDSGIGELQDYKFLCFDGEPYYCWVDMGRYTTHTRNVYNLNWELQPWNQERYGIYKDPIEKPLNFDEMIRVAKELSSGFSHVRVDLYNVKGKIFFGEMTFTNGCGFDKIIPEKYDYELGKLWHVDTSNQTTILSASSI